MLVIVKVPRGVTKVCPTAAIAVPFNVTEPRPSGVSNTMLPAVVSAVDEGFEPDGSLPRAGSAASWTDDVALTEPAGWSGVMIIVVGSSSVSCGIISRSSGSGNASCVGGNKSPSANGSPISPTGSAKLPPELCGRPAAGCGSWPISKAAMLSGGTATPSTIICGTKIAPSGTTICVPSGIWMIRSRPETLMSSRPTPAGNTS